MLSPGRWVPLVLRGLSRPPEAQQSAHVSGALPPFTGPAGAIMGGVSARSTLGCVIPPALGPGGASLGSAGLPWRGVLAHRMSVSRLMPVW